MSSEPQRSKASSNSYESWIAAAGNLLARGEIDAAGLRRWLVADSANFPGGVVLPGRFTAIAQAVGYRTVDQEVADFLGSFVREAKASGLIARLMAQHGLNRNRRRGDSDARNARRTATFERCSLTFKCRDRWTV